MFYRPVIFLLAFASLTLSGAPNFQEITQREANERLRDFGIPELKKGEELYSKVCLACHGNFEQPVINETIRQFHSQPLKNGSDPHALYQTLTKGYNTMAPQPWMKPEEKYYVIHYLRETFFREANPSQYTTIDERYLATLDQPGIKEEKLVWPIDGSVPQLAEKVEHEDVDLGRALFGHFEVDTNNIVPKGLIVALDPDARSVADSQHNALYDLDTGRLAAIWTGGSLDWEDLNYNGQHSRNARIVGETFFESPMGLAWANATEVLPGMGPDFRDSREEGRDGRRYGPLPKEHFQYLGLRLDSAYPTLHYRVHGSEVLDTSYARLVEDRTYSIRTIRVAPHKIPFFLRFQGKEEHVTTRATVGAFGTLGINDGILRIGPSERARDFHIIATTSDNREALKKMDLKQLGLIEPVPFRQITPASAQYAATLDEKSFPADQVAQAVYQEGSEDGPFRIDAIELPEDVYNPWKSRLRLSGVDYLDGNTVALSSWTGGLYLAHNIRGTEGPTVRISRVAAGLHQPLGLVVRDGEIFVGCRDQIMRPHDFDNDGVADYLEAFNSDHVVTMHFHDFAAGLDTDPDGNFYYSKCSQHLDPAIVESHGTLMKVSADGGRSEIMARGLRSNNGCFYDEKTKHVWVTDQEGFWNPQNKIIRVEPGSFNGNMLAYYDSSSVTHADADSSEPMVWLPKQYANSPSEVFRFPEKGWGGLNDSLGYFEYGKGRIMVLPYEERGSLVQGAAHSLPIPDFPTGVMRGRFHPDDQSLLACGLFGWGSSQTQTGGLFRVIPTGKPSYCVTGFATAPGQLTLTLSDPIASGFSTSDVELASFHIARSEKYGSQLEDESRFSVTEVAVSADGRSIVLDVPDLKPTRVLNIKLKLPTPTGPAEREVHASIYLLGDEVYDSQQAAATAQANRVRPVTVPEFHEVPGRIQAEAFMPGGEGVAYHDSDEQRGVPTFRPESAVDLEPSRDDGTPSVGWTADKEWLSYRVKVAKGMKVRPILRYSSTELGKARLLVKLEGKDEYRELAEWELKPTGGYYNWRNTGRPAIELPAGTHTLRLFVEKGLFNLNWIELR